MAGPIRNLSFARGHVAADTSNTLYTVPTGYVLLLKSIYIRPDSTASWFLNVELQGGGANVYIISVAGVAAANIDWQSWTALNGDDAIVLATNYVGCAYWMAGALLPFAPGLPAQVAQDGPERSEPIPPGSLAAD